MSILLACMHVYHECFWCPQRSPGLMDGYETPCKCWEPNLGLCQCSELLGCLSSPPSAFWRLWTVLVASHPYNLHIKIVLVKCFFDL